MYICTYGQWKTFKTSMEFSILKKKIVTNTMPETLKIRV